MTRLSRRRFIHSAAVSGSFLACYSVADPATAADIRITPPVIDTLTMQVLVDGVLSVSPLAGAGIQWA